MYEKLFKQPAVLSRHRNAPYAKERERYLAHCAEKGYARSTLLLFARELLWVARKLNISPGRQVSVHQITGALHGWVERERCCGQTLNLRWTRKRFMEVARPWLRFLGCLHKLSTPVPFVHLIENHVKWMQNEQGLSPTTIQRQREYLRQFLRWYGAQERFFSEVQIADIDNFLAHCGKQGWVRISVKNMANALRRFFRYAGKQGWCNPSIANAIEGPRVFTHEMLPSGPSWSDVKRLLASTESEAPSDIRDRAILMLFAIYGWRSSEVSRLRLNDIDWKGDFIFVSRAKRGGKQKYPLVATVGHAILRYLQKVRPRSTKPEVFLTQTAPFHCLSRGAMSSLVRKRMRILGIHARHQGPHALRHACAAHLVQEGFSLKEIGDHLGHRSSSATRIYAKVDLSGLREVATFDLGGLA